jgi:hypothetical protein
MTKNYKNNKKIIKIFLFKMFECKYKLYNINKWRLTIFNLQLTASTSRAVITTSSTTLLPTDYLNCFVVFSDVSVPPTSTIDHPFSLFCSVSVY